MAAVDDRTVRWSGRFGMRLAGLGLKMKNDMLFKKEEKYIFATGGLGWVYLEQIIVSEDYGNRKNWTPFLRKSDALR